MCVRFSARRRARLPDQPPTPTISEHIHEVCPSFPAGSGFGAAGAVPGPNDVAVLRRSDPLDNFSPVPHVQLDGALTLKGLVVEAGRMEGNHTITVTDFMEWRDGDLAYTNTAPFFSPSLIIIAPSAVMTFTPNAFALMGFDGSFRNLGVMRIDAAPGVYSGFNNCVVLENAGTLTVRRGGSFSLGCPIHNTGAIDVNMAPNDRVTFASIRNDGDIELGGGEVRIGSLDNGITQRSGSTRLNNAKLEGGVVLDGGFLEGSGVITSTRVTNRALLNPTGRLTLSFFGGPAFTQSPTGTLQIDIAGAGQADQIALTNFSAVAQLDGTIDVNFVSGFIPASGDSFIVLTAESINGAFATEDSSLPVRYSATHVVVGAALDKLVYLPVAGK
jgi:hypothetical protein